VRGSSNFSKSCSACRLFRVFESTAPPRDFSAALRRSRGIGSRPEFCTGRVSPLWLKRSHCAVDPCPRPCGLPAAGITGRFLGVRSFLSSSSAFLQSPRFRSYPGAVPGGTSPRSSLELCFPTAHAAVEGPLTAGPLPWPATFRLQGLVTLLTVSALRRLAGLVSFRQRPWD